MAFDDKAKPVSDEALLLQIVDKDEAGEALKVCHATFDDGTTLDFPEGCRFPPNNHHDDATGRLVQVRVQAIPPIRNGKAGATFFIPQGVTKLYVKKAVERLERGV